MTNNLIYATADALDSENWTREQCIEFIIDIKDIHKAQNKLQLKIQSSTERLNQLEQCLSSGIENLESVYEGLFNNSDIIFIEEELNCIQTVFRNWSYKVQDSLEALEITTTEQLENYILELEVHKNVLISFKKTFKYALNISDPVYN